VIFAVINRSAALDTDVAFWAEGCNLQAREIAAAHGLEYTPVVFLSGADDLPADARVLTINDSIDVAGALGDHYVNGGAILADVKHVGAQTSTVISHEIGETLVDPLCNRWAPYDADHEQAVEVCDRTEGDSYAVMATVAGETRPVRVSNYLFPRAFGEDSTPGPFDRMGLIKSTTHIRPGGYVIVRDITTGKTGNIFARVATAAGGATVAAKRANPRSRLARRLGG
jgi:hypothetical protein